MVIQQSTGNIGIGTSTPSGILDVYATNGGSNLLNLETSTGNKVTVLNNGNVGIGTSVPMSRLSVQGAIQAASISLTSLTADSGAFNQAVTASSGIFTAMGGLVIGPTLFYWCARIQAEKEDTTRSVCANTHHPHCVLERRRYSTLGRLVAGEGAMVAVKKLAADQLLFAPPFLAVILSLCVTITCVLCHHPAPLA
jgi:hypothetical protein